MSERRPDGDPPGTRRARGVALGAGAVATILGLTVLVGWHIHAEVLTRIVPAFPAMQARTALGILLCGVALLSTPRRRGLTAACGGLVAALGLGSLLEQLLAVELRIDDLLESARLSLADPARGPMSTAGALALSLAGVSLLWGSRASWRRHAALPVGILGVTVVAIGAVVALAYLTGLRPAGVAPAAGMALHTALGFAVVGTGILARAQADPETRTVAKLGWLPLAVGIGVVGATVLLWLGSLARERGQLEQVVDAESRAVSDEIGDDLHLLIGPLARMARRWEVRERPERAAWEADVRLLLADEESLEAIEWAEASLDGRWRVERGGEGRSSALGPAFEARRREALARARDEGRAAGSHAFVLPQGGHGFLIGVPMYRGGRPGGFIVGVFRSATLLEEIASNVAIDYSVVVLDGDEEIFRRANGTDDTAIAHTTSIPLDVVDWRARLGSDSRTLVEAHSYLTDVTMVTGVLVALSLMLAIHLGQATRRRAAQLEAMADALAAEVAERATAQAALSAANCDLDEQARELARSNADLEQFAYLASHDLQEPLRMVSSYGQLLARRYQGRLDRDADEFIGYMTDGVTRMRALIEDLLAYSRVGRREEGTESTAGADALRVAVGNLAPTIQAAAAEVTYGTLPTLAVCSTELVQLFQNLIGNAIKFRRDERLTVRITAERRGGEWLFAVRDNGIGLDVRYGEKIFGMFQRLHGRAEHGGTGIGLAICRKIVERHRGRIWVESEPGHGSTFFFTLPVGDEVAVEEDDHATHRHLAG